MRFKVCLCSWEWSLTFTCVAENEVYLLPVWPRVKFNFCLCGREWSLTLACVAENEISLLPVRPRMKFGSPLGFLRFRFRTKFCWFFWILEFSAFVVSFVTRHDVLILDSLRWCGNTPGTIHFVYTQHNWLLGVPVIEYVGGKYAYLCWIRNEVLFCFKDGRNIEEVMGRIK